MRSPLKPSTLITLTLCTLALAACGKAEPKMGNLTQRFALMDAEGRNFGVVELDPVGGGRIVDVSGRLVGRVVAPDQSMAATVSAAPQAVQ